MNLAAFFAEFKTALFDSYHNNPKDFREKFSWNKNWTKYVQEKLKEILGNDKKEYYPEYFDIDHTWWRVEKTDRFAGARLHTWEMTIAIEHENASRDWTYEVEKLDSILCPLRIVIGYMPVGKRKKESDIVDKQRLRMPHLIRGEGCNGEFGVILLNNSLKEDEEDPFNMKCYLLTEQGTKELYKGEWRG